MKSSSTTLSSSSPRSGNSHRIKRSKSQSTSSQSSTSKKSKSSSLSFCLGFAVGVTLLLNIQNSLFLTTTTTTTSSSLGGDYESSFYYFYNTPNPPSKSTTTKSTKSSTTKSITKGQQIISNAYNKAYYDLTTKYCPDMGRDYFINTDLPNQFEIFRVCLNRTYSLIIENPNPLVANQYPWWFLTLLRDTASKKSGLHGRWHYISLSDEVEMCIYEKGGTKHWKKVLQNQEESLGIKPYKGQHSEKSQIVFIRDPLDRFLSGFLDKCVTRRYVGEGHCEPSEIFQVEYLDMQETQKIIGYGEERKIYRKWVESSNYTTNLVSDFRKSFNDLFGTKIPQKLLFDTYVDTFPLKWNVHFIPLSFQCGGLYNTLQYYNFKGNMGTNFYNELYKLIILYPSIKESVNSIFQLELELENHTTTHNENNDENQKQQQQQQQASSASVTNNKTKTTNTKTNNNNVGVETQAASKVMQYYTPRTVKKVLEYVSIDYMLLDIPIPKWAEDMLLLLDE